MGQRALIGTLAVVLTCGLAIAVAQARQNEHADRAGHAAQQIDHAVAVIRPTGVAAGRDAHGTVHFEQREHGVYVTVHVEDLEPGSVHGLHIHRYGDLTSDDGSALGPHYNPGQHEHELPPDEPRHAGDLGNIQADDQGVAEAEMMVESISIAGPRHAILGRSVVVHAQRDTGEGSSGEAGPRIAAGVIGIAE